MKDIINVTISMPTVIYLIVVLLLVVIYASIEKDESCNSMYKSGVIVFIFIVFTLLFGGIFWW